ncbi:MAG: glycosyltransferase [Verrucomicrobiaceae bacterium]|nr:MAG: glycosyltransferase [Verrucomicrobiaceae bacterium]
MLDVPTNPSLVISVIVPLHNHGAILPSFLKELSTVLEQHYSYYEILLIDNGSTDESERLVDKLINSISRVRYLVLSRWHGKEVAISAGLESAIGDFIVVINPDTDPVEMIPDLVERCRQGSGIMYGISSQPKHRGLAAVASRGFHFYCRKFLGFDYKQDTTDFCVLSRQIVNALTRIKDRHRFLRIYAARLGYAQEFFSYDIIERIPGAAHEGLFKHLNNALEIAISNSRHPLRVVSRLGLLMSFLNFLYVFYIAGVWIFKRRVAEGWTTASLQHTTMFFFVFLILAILCEYVGRILEETQNRPLYFVSHEKTSSVLLEASVNKNILSQSADSHDGH